MDIKCIFAPYLYAFKFNGRDLDEYNLGIDQWNDIIYLKNFYNQNLKFIRDNKYFPKQDLLGFIETITENVEIFDDALIAAAKSGTIKEHFEILTKTKNYRELLPHKKARQNVLRFYGIMLDDTMIITGSAIKLTDRMEKHDLTRQQIVKLESVQDFLLQNQIVDEESFFEYLQTHDYEQ